MTEQLNPPSETSKAMEIATQWAQLPVEYLEAALRALEPQLKRDHVMEMARMQADIAAKAKIAEIEAGEKAGIRDAEAANRAAEAAERAESRRHTLNMTGLIAGFALSGGMVVGALIAGLHGQLGLAAMLLGPSLLALAALFVTRKVDPTLARAVAAQKPKTVDVTGAAVK